MHPGFSREHVPEGAEPLPETCHLGRFFILFFYRCQEAKMEIINTHICVCLCDKMSFCKAFFTTINPLTVEQPARAESDDFSDTVFKIKI